MWWKCPALFNFASGDRIVGGNIREVEYFGGCLLIDGHHIWSHGKLFFSRTNATKRCTHGFASVFR